MSDRLLKESDVLRIAFQLPLVVNSMFADAVKALPSVDKPQGKWIHSHEGTIAEGLYCSNCGKHGHGEKFCPNCGTRMKGTDDE